MASFYTLPHGEKPATPTTMGAVKVHVKNYFVRRDAAADNTEYVVYELDVKDGHTTVSTVAKRFSQFFALYTHIQQSHPALLKLKDVPAFPWRLPVADTLITAKIDTEKHLQLRQAALQKWLQWLVDVPAMCATWFPLQMFLLLPNLRGRLAIVTGATSGIGRATALGLAQLGCTVVVAARSHDKGLITAGFIKEESHNPNVHVLNLDLADLSSVRKFADDFSKTFGAHAPVHILVNNAGVRGFLSSQLTVDGFEQQFAVNFLGHFLLTNLLLEHLRQASGGARIVNVADREHRAALGLNLADVKTAPSVDNVGHRYAQSKLAVVMFTMALARRLRGSKVTATCVHPGDVASEIWRSQPGVLSWVNKQFKESSEAGALPVLYLAVSEVIEGTSGKYFENTMLEAEPHKFVEDVLMQDRLVAEATTWTQTFTERVESKIGNTLKKLLK